MASSEDVFRKYQEYVATSFVKKVEPIAIAEGRGAYVKDLDGKEYLDCFSGISLANMSVDTSELLSRLSQESLERRRTLLSMG